MLRWSLFIVTLIITEVLGWFAVTGILFIEFLIRPYTSLGQEIVIWGSHIFMAIAIFISCFLLFFLKDS